VTTCSDAAVQNAGLAFNTIAEQYDEMFTHSLIGRSQRGAVWEVLRQTFTSGERVLELNCGTGEDALFLARMGVSVVACDASERMIAVAARRMAAEVVGAEVQFKVVSNERIGELSDAAVFDGAFSNFSGLNCVADLFAVARQLASLIKPCGRILLCFSSRVCLWETLWYLAHGELSRSVRRWKGSATASLANIALRVQYPTMTDIQNQFRPFFRLRGCKGIGVAVPPSYVEHVARKHPHALNGLVAIDRIVATWPVFRVIGDHMLLTLERSEI
jgi:ubiquinone/menaquinone biosynthesis C-methylase UbiE